MRALVLALALAATSAVSAADFSGVEVFIPVISRVAGANDTRWRTDLVITNRSETDGTTAKMVYDPVGGAPLQGSFFIPARGTVTIPDVLSEVFELDQTYGTLRITSLDDHVKLMAHARIYNVGTAEGEFGQLIQGLPLEQLGERAWLNGLIAIRDNRANVGIGNPNNAVTNVSLSWYDKNGDLQGTRGGFTIQPWDVLLLNDIFSILGFSPDEGLSIRVTSDRTMYAYASIVRNDTGDAYTIMGDGTD